MLGRLIGGFITILVGATLVPVVADEVAYAKDWNSTGTHVNDTVTGAARTIVGLVTLFFALGVMSAGISVAIGGLRDAGLM